MKLFDNVRFVQSLTPTAARTSDVNGSAVDTQGFENGMVIISAGVIDTTDGNETYAFIVEDSADGSNGWAPVTGLTATVTASGQVRYIRLRELNVAVRRHLRVVLDVGGTTPSILCSAGIALAGKINGPENND
jgi:hypothetical protein